MGDLRAELDLPLGVYASRAARHASTAVLRGWGLSDAMWLHAAGLVVGELVGNAVRHGGGCVGLTLEMHDGRVRVLVADGSSVLPRRREPDGAGGLGLVLIEAFSDGWGVDDFQGGKRIWVLLPRHPEPPDNEVPDLR